MKKNFILGFLISFFFIYLSLKGINFSELEASLKSADFIYLLPVLILVLSLLLLRAYRWGVILSPLIKYDLKTLFTITSIGFMVGSIIPARIGELARPYIVKQKNSIRMSSTIATVVVERIFDMLALMFILFFVILVIPLPEALFNTGITILVVSIAAFMMLIFISVKKDFSLKKADAIFEKLPSKPASFLKHLFHAFVEGLQILPDIKKTLYLFFLSVLVWVFNSGTFYVMFYAFGFELSFIDACALMVIAAIAVILPAPGFVGTFHYACILGLSYFGISKSEAASYSVLLHFLQFIPIVVLGFVFLPFQKISLPGFLKREQEELKKEELDN
jgi:uncharacterized protein (TIRG00374 family)